MSTTPVRFYQVGSYAAGNRLRDEGDRTVQAGAARTNALDSGHRACQGCGEALGARYVLDAAMRSCDGRLLVVNATGCLEVFSTPFPETSWRIPWLHSLFGNAASVATGVSAALRVNGRSDVRVLAQAGDGGTVDIGLACLSGLFERDDDVLFVCYDNEAYMNTGVQRSGATPPAARTATTEAVGPAPGNPFGQGKDLPADRHGPRPPLRGHRHRGRPARPRGQSGAGHGRDGARGTCTCSCPARSGGEPPRPRPSSWPGWPTRRVSSRCSRPATAW